MRTNVLSSIICSEFRKEFQSPERLKDGFLSEPNKAMQIRFKMNPDFDVEEGYRNLSILIFGAGSNYITVMAKMDWTVIQNEDINDDGEGLKKGKEYTKGETPWVPFSCHDSCWTSDGVESIIQRFRNRINCMDSRFDRWYETLTLTPEQIEDFNQITRDTLEGKLTHSCKFETLEFKFPVKK
jgi:hypothetical protein